MILLKNVRNHKIVYVVSFYDGYIDGSKFDVDSLDTTYSSFVAIYGAQYFETYDEAKKVSDKLNKEFKNGTL